MEKPAFLLQCLSEYTLIVLIPLSFSLEKTWDCHTTDGNGIFSVFDKIKFWPHDGVKKIGRWLQKILKFIFRGNECVYNCLWQIAQWLLRHFTPKRKWHNLQWAAIDSHVFIKTIVCQSHQFKKQLWFGDYFCPLNNSMCRSCLNRPNCTSSSCSVWQWTTVCGYVHPAVCWQTQHVRKTFNSWSFWGFPNPEII